MNTHIERLYHIASKPERLIIGLMSGTSMDGLDVALCRFRASGTDTEVSLLAFETVDFTEDIKDEIRKVFARAQIDFQHLCLLHPWVAHLHADIVLQCLTRWKIDPKSIDVIASHGQTVFHAPKILHQLDPFPNATLQIGDGDHMAVRTGIITISDFRQKHCAAGGEGAPLAVYGDYLIFSQLGESRILLNMGGIANFTFLSGDLDADQVFATDTGPGNTMIDAYVKRHFDLSYDADSKLALLGVVNAALLKALKNDAFFTQSFPKTTGPELFNLDYLMRAQESSGTVDVNHHDILHTLCRFSADTIVEAIQSMPTQIRHIYASGGGVHNPLLMQYIRELLPSAQFMTTDDLGIPGDAKEAVLFATLANEALAGGKTDFGSRRGVPSVSMGKISFPG
jgi:anhydro-N-acetylmuramic acid kinase